MIAPLLAALGVFAVPTASPPAEVTLAWDVDHARPAQDKTDVYVWSDGKFLYLRFNAQQRAPIVATQHSDDTITGGSNINGGIAWSDDAVWVDLWPKGPAGFQYQFEANPNGAHNEASTENVSFAPHWESHGERTANGYEVTMANSVRRDPRCACRDVARAVRAVRALDGRPRRVVVRVRADES